MCLIGLAFQHVPRAPLLVMANRDEARRRPTLPPALRVHPASGTRWLGGLDELAGGTWLGVNEFGLLVSVTNRRRVVPPSRRRSRGLLCCDLLACGSVRDALDVALRELRGDHYDGCNILLASRSEAAFVAGADQMAHRFLEPGLHVLANGPLDDAEDRRTERLRRHLVELDESSADGLSWIEMGSRLLGLGADADEPALVLTGATRGTVSATCVALAADVGDSIYRYADGPPHETPFDDYSALLQDLLKRERRDGDRS